MSPLEVSILIHACCRADAVPNGDAPAVVAAVIALENLGLLSMLGHQKVRATEDGQAWLAAICATKRPTKGWFSADGTRLDHLMSPSLVPATSVENHQ